MIKSYFSNFITITLYLFIVLYNSLSFECFFLYINKRVNVIQDLEFGSDIAFVYSCRQRRHCHHLP